MGIKFLNSPAACAGHLENILGSFQPAFVARIGGSDTHAVVTYNVTPDVGRSPPLAPRIVSHRDHVSMYNGYYDKANSEQNFKLYLENLFKLYGNCETLFVVCRELNAIYYNENDDPCFHDIDKTTLAEYKLLIDSLYQNPQGTVVAMPYNFVESLLNNEYGLLRTLSKTLPGKRVLCVSPFSESINSNFHNRFNFFKDYNYPDFAIQTIQSPITYSGLPDELYPDGNWHETVRRLEHEVSQYEFDVALLSCGSYAMPLGEYIKTTLGKKAIYVGGVMQLFFGVMGRRYESEFFTSQMNLEKFIKPIEAQNYMRFVNVRPEDPTEAFGAYL